MHKAVLITCRNITNSTTFSILQITRKKFVSFCLSTLSVNMRMIHIMKFDILIKTNLYVALYWVKNCCNLSSCLTPMSLLSEQHFLSDLKPLAVGWDWWCSESLTVSQLLSNGKPSCVDYLQKIWQDFWSERLLVCYITNMKSVGTTRLCSLRPTACIKYALSCWHSPYALT